MFDRVSDSFNGVFKKLDGQTDEEGKEISGAFLQLYREEGYYLERTVHYIERVGLDYVKKHVLDDTANRKALYERLLFALQDYVDPWQEHAEKAELRRNFEDVTA